MRTGSFRPVHINSASNSLTLGLLKSRKLLVAKLRDLQGGVRGFLLGFGSKIPPGQVVAFAPKVQLAIRNHFDAAAVVVPLLEVCSAVLKESKKLDARLAELAADDPICQLLKTAPGVGSITALLFRSAVDQPERFANSRAVGVTFGLRRGPISPVTGSDEATSASAET